MFIITGTPRSGTKYISEVLNIAHEKCFVPGGPKPPLVNEASWLAVPYVEQYPQVTVVHLIRNPLDVVTSLVRIGHMDIASTGRGRDPFVRFLYEHCPQAALPTPEESAIRFYIDWNRRASAVSDDTWRLDLLDFNYIEKVTGRVVNPDVPRDTNSKPHRNIHTPDFSVVPEVLWDEFVDYAKELGYEL